MSYALINVYLNIRKSSWVYKAAIQNTLDDYLHVINLLLTWVALLPSRSNTLTSMLIDYSLHKQLSTNLHFEGHLPTIVQL